MCNTKYSNGFVEINVKFCALEISLILVRIKNVKRETKNNYVHKKQFLENHQMSPKKGVKLHILRSIFNVYSVFDPGFDF